MKNITHLVSDVYLPKKAIVVYSNFTDTENKHYAEAFDIDKNGKPINAHPLSKIECAKFAVTLRSDSDGRKDFLKSKSILPENILYVDQQEDGCAIWYTPSQRARLFFKKNLGISSGNAYVPALVWKASKDKLHLYALEENKKPKENTPLCYAPFFNIHDDGRVCMGTVEIELENDCCLEEFIKIWESYFWDSYFSHALDNYSPASINIVQLWKEQMNTKRKFPTGFLIKRNRKLKDILP